MVTTAIMTVSARFRVVSDQLSGVLESLMV